METSSGNLQENTVVSVIYDIKIFTQISIYFKIT